MTIFEELPEFKRDLGKLLKKYKSLKEDLDVVRLVLCVYPDERAPFSFRINSLGIDKCIIKVKKIASKSFKGRGVNSGFRLIYAYFNSDNRIVFIELYHKNEKDNEDRERIIRNFSD